MGGIFNGDYIQIKRLSENVRNQNYELIFAKTWDDTKRGIGWIEGLPGISPGRWAVGYNYLYAMSRVLNEKEPKCVLDIGLGISSTLISQYFKGNNDKEGIHDIIEHDAKWIEFYSKKHELSDLSAIHTVECIEKELRGVKYNAYKDISAVVKGKKYDVISIDGPLGSDKYSRRDIIEFVPTILNESFVIMMDDSQRDGEQATIMEIEEKLKQSEIEFCEGVYPGKTYCTLITSADNKFLCSM